MAREVRLIDAEALLKQRFNMYTGFQGTVPVVAVRDIDNATTIDPESLRLKGRWEDADDGDGVVCSVCREDFCNLIYEIERFKYCPNCGAKMEE